MTTSTRAGVCIGIVLITACTSDRPQAEPPAATIRATPSTAQIGEPIELAIAVPDRAATLDLSGLPPRLDGRREVDEVRRGSRTEWRVMATSLLPGPVDIPALPVRMGAGGHDGVAVVHTPPVTIEFTAPPVSADDPLRPMSGRLDAGWTSPLLMATAAAFGLACAGLGVRRLAAPYVARWRRRRRWNRWRARLRQLESRARHADDDESRLVVHTAAALFRSAVADATDSAVPFRPSPAIVAIARARPGDASAATAVEHALAALDAIRFARVVNAGDAARVIAQTSVVVGLLRPGSPPRGRA